MWGLEGVVCRGPPPDSFEGASNRDHNHEPAASFHQRVRPGSCRPFSRTSARGGGDAFPAFSGKDDGTAIEVYPDTQVLVPGDGAVECRSAGPDTAKTFVHAAIASLLPADEIIALGRRQGWISRLYDRGPFQCVEIWLENRLLIEVLDPEMLADYRAGMTIRNWVEMFGPEVRPV
jgi:hypothetical protein